MDYTLEKLEVCNIAEEFSDEIWNIVDGWKFFLNDTMGKQMVRAADSISATLLKGMGDIITKKASNFIFIREAQYKRLRHSSENVKEEK